MHADSYENFGWQLEGTDSTVPGKKDVTLKLKWDRNILQAPWHKQDCTGSLFLDI